MSEPRRIGEAAAEFIEEIRAAYKPRDPARIQRLLGTLEHYWRRYPDLRLGQIIGNFSRDTDPYFIEDTELTARLEQALHEEPQEPAA